MIRPVMELRAENIVVPVFAGGLRSSSPPSTCNRQRKAAKICVCQDVGQDCVVDASSVMRANKGSCKTHGTLVLND